MSGIDCRASRFLFLLAFELTIVHRQFRFLIYLTGIDRPILAIAWSAGYGFRLLRERGEFIFETPHLCEHVCVVLTGLGCFWAEMLV